MLTRLGAACFAGLLYFAVVFSFAFAMGAARTLVVAPWLGTMAAVLLEVPVVVAASWGVARRLLRHRCFTLAQRGVMGGVAFALTMASEAALAAAMRGQGVVDWAAEVATRPGLIGLAGQLAFAAVPVLVRDRTAKAMPEA